MSPIILRRVKGHSMLPTLPPETLIWGFKWYNRLKVGDIVVFLHDGKEKIKRINEIIGDDLELLGDNSNGSSDSRQFGNVPSSEVIAKVVWPRASKDRIE